MLLKNQVTNNTSTYDAVFQQFIDIEIILYSLRITTNILWRNI